MKKLDTLTGAIALLSCGLWHCSSELAPSTEPEPSGGAAVTGGATSAGAAGGGVDSSGGNALSGTGGSAGAVSGSGTSAGGHGGGGGTAGGTGGTGGTSGTGSGSDGNCESGGILCEDFEPYPAASAPAGGWMASTRGDGKIVVDATRAFSGKQSLHVNGRMNADRANISRPIQTDSPTAYVRFMYYAVSYPASSGVHTRLMRIGTAQAASGNPDSSYSLASYNGTAIEKVNSIYLRDTGTKLNAASLLNRWSCLEFAIDKSEGVGKVKVQLWVDGKELKLSEAGSPTHGMTSPSWDPIPFELFMLGLDGFQSDPEAADFWIDDLLVTPQRVGCKPAE
jgi:hypothetical protein